MQADLFTEVIYSPPTLDRTMRQTSESFRALFDPEDPNARIVAEDLVQYCAFGSEGFDQTESVQHFRTGMKNMIQHIINSLNRVAFIDEASNVDEQVEELV